MVIFCREFNSLQESILVLIFMTIKKSCRPKTQLTQQILNNCFLTITYLSKNDEINSFFPLNNRKYADGSKIIRVIERRIIA